MRNFLPSWLRVSRPSPALPQEQWPPKESRSPAEAANGADITGELRWLQGNSPNSPSREESMMAQTDNEDGRPSIPEESNRPPNDEDDNDDNDDESSKADKNPPPDPPPVEIPEDRSRSRKRRASSDIDRDSLYRFWSVPVRRRVPMRLRQLDKQRSALARFRFSLKSRRAQLRCTRNSIDEREDRVVESLRGLFDKEPQFARSLIADVDQLHSERDSFRQDEAQYDADEDELANMEWDIRESERELFEKVLSPYKDHGTTGTAQSQFSSTISLSPSHSPSGITGDKENISSSTVEQWSSIRREMNHQRIQLQALESEHDNLLAESADRTALGLEPDHDREKYMWDVVFRFSDVKERLGELERQLATISDTLGLNLPDRHFSLDQFAESGTQEVIGVKTSVESMELDLDRIVQGANGDAPDLAVNPFLPLERDPTISIPNSSLRLPAEDYNSLSSSLTYLSSSFRHGPATGISEYINSWFLSILRASRHQVFMYFLYGDREFLLDTWNDFLSWVFRFWKSDGAFAAYCEHREHRRTPEPSDPTHSIHIMQYSFSGASSLSLLRLPEPKFS